MRLLWHLPLQHPARFPRERLRHEGHLQLLALGSYYILRVLGEIRGIHDRRFFPVSDGEVEQPVLLLVACLKVKSVPNLLTEEMTGFGSRVMNLFVNFETNPRFMKLAAW